MAPETRPGPARPLPAHVRQLLRRVLVLGGLAAGLWACGAAPVAPLAATPTTPVASAAPATPAPPAVPGPTSYSVHVVNHGWHAGLVLRAGDVPAGAWPARADFPRAAYLEVGWGDRAYYQAADPGLWLGLKALAWPTPGVLHVVGLGNTPQRTFPGAEILEIGLAPAGLQRLIAHLRQSHTLDGAGRPIPLGPGLYGHSRFYAARGQFHLLQTCNVWVATALQAAGVPVTPTLTLSTERLMRQLRPLSQAGRS